MVLLERVMVVNFYMLAYYVYMLTRNSIVLIYAHHCCPMLYFLFKRVSLKNVRVRVYMCDCLAMLRQSRLLLLPTIMSHPNRSLFISSGPRPAPMARSSFVVRRSREVQVAGSPFPPAARVQARALPSAQALIFPTPSSIFPTADKENTLRDTCLAASLAIPPTKARRPREADRYDPSPFRPPVSANR